MDKTSVKNIFAGNIPSDNQLPGVIVCEIKKEHIAF